MRVREKLKTSKLQLLDAGENPKRGKLHSDGGGLYLRVREDSPGAPLSRTWIFRYSRGIKRTPSFKQIDLGLGSLADVLPKIARHEAHKLRAAIRAGRDPKADRMAEKAAREAARHAALANPPSTFKALADAYIKAHSGEWKAASSERDWKGSLEKWAHPIIGQVDVGSINTGMVMEVLQQDVDGSTFWAAKTATATNVRSRIELVLDFAAVQKLRPEGAPNPARWRNHLALLLPKPSKVSRVESHPALPVADMPDFVRRLREAEDSTRAAALAFVILTATRASEACEAEWDEFDLEQRLWTVPAARMKGDRVHLVPLSDAAVAVLERQKTRRVNGHVFPGQQDRSPSISSDRMREMLRKLEPDPKRCDVHGFRSTFRDWCGDETDHAWETAEHALAHQVGGKTVRAYARSTQFKKRLALMQQWADFLAGKTQEGANVVPLKA
jgi:integrase